MSTKLFPRTISLVLALAVLISANVIPASAASSPAPMSSLVVYGAINSYDEDGRVTNERVPLQLPSLSKSMWFSDSASDVRPAITVYNNGGAVKHYRDKVEITVRQVGQGGTIIMLDGKRATLSATQKIISSYPATFIKEMTYTIERSKIDPDAPYTIFTAESLEVTNPNSSPIYTRFETDVYIYWAD